MLYLQPPQVLNCITKFSEIDDARTLYCKLLNYDYQDLPIPIEDWTKSAKEIIIDGKIIAKERGLLGVFELVKQRLKKARSLKKVR